MLQAMEKDSKSRAPRSRRILHMEVPPEWMERLDAWRAAHEFPPSRSEAVRIMVDRFIEADAARRAAPELAKVE